MPNCYRHFFQPALTSFITLSRRIVMVGDGTSELIPGEPTGPSFFQRYGLSESWRYGSANLLLLLGAASILVGGWAPWLVLAVAMILGSFADEVSGDDRTTLNDGTCLFCKINLYLSLPLVCILALVLVRFAATQPSLTEHPFQLIGVLWLAATFALVEAVRLHRHGLAPWSRHNRLILAHITPLSIVVLAGLFAGPIGSTGRGAIARRSDASASTLVLARELGLEPGTNGWGFNMSSPSFSYEESAPSHLEKVQALPVEVQADIASGVDNYIKIAKAAKDDALVERIASTAMEVQAKATGQGMNSTLDPRWAAPAIAEAWCYATISLSRGYLNRLHAEAIIAAIEAFTSSRS